jgi:xanthine dehydrogenase YagS FAD-binding subunit
MRSFTYARPHTVDEAITMIATRAPGRQPRFLAGGTTLVDLMKLNVETPDQLIDITGVPELAGYDVSAAATGRGELVFGALARMSDVADDPALKSSYPALSEALWKAASQQLRNMATIGGNLLQRTRCAYFRERQYPCNKREPGTGCSAIDGISRGHAILGVSDSCIAVYPSDWAVALAAFDAVVDVAGPQGTRSIPLLELHLRPGNTPQRETILEPDELITRVRVPVTRAGAGKASTYQKIRDRESYAFALTSAAVALEFADSRVRDARIALGGVATTPWRARSAEQTLIGLPQPVTEAAARRAGEIAFADAHTTKMNAFKVPLGIQTVVESVLIAQERAQERG